MPRGRGNNRILWESSGTRRSQRTSRDAPDESGNTVTNILNLPIEILEHIFRFLHFQNIAQIRRVCKLFNDVCSNILNKEFGHLRSLMQQRFQNIKAQMPRRESSRRKHPLARESDIIETLHMRLTLLQMTFGKHIERRHCCFFAGEILDEVYRILRYVKSSSPNLNRAYKVTDELFDLSTMAMEYFKESIEPTLPEITYFATDLLDYTPSLSSSPKTQISLLEDPTTRTCPSPSKTLRSSCRESPDVDKRLRRLRENMRRNSGQVQTLKQELRDTRKKVTTQQRQIEEMKAHFEEYDRKFQSTSKKLSAVLQELGRCKTELQYWRSKSPASSLCSCGKVTPVPSDPLLPPPLEPGEEFFFPEGFDDFKPILLDLDQASSSSASSSYSRTRSSSVIVRTPKSLVDSSIFSTPSSSSSKMSQEYSAPPPPPMLGEKLAPRACKRKAESSSTPDKGLIKSKFPKRCLRSDENPNSTK